MENILCVIDEKGKKIVFKTGTNGTLFICDNSECTITLNREQVRELKRMLRGYAN